MDVVSACDPVAFAEKVLRGISAIGIPGDTGADLSLELRLSIWMRQTHLEIDDALPAMWALRSALLKTSEIDRATEPVPLHGVDPRLDVLNLAGYLKGLVVRATARSLGDSGLVDRVLENLRRDMSYGRSGSITRALG
jgi:hypothetical protein